MVNTVESTVDSLYGADSTVGSFWDGLWGMYVVGKCSWKNRDVGEFRDVASFVMLAQSFQLPFPTTRKTSVVIHNFI